MKCERAKELFSEYLEGGADHALTDTIRRHMGQCSSCAREFELFKQTRCMLEALPEAEPPMEFRHDVVMRVARMQHERERGTAGRILGFSWESLLGGLRPARAVAIACAFAAFAIVLLTVPDSAYDYFAGVFNPGVRIVQSVEPQQSANVVEASPLSKLESRRKHEWQARKLGRNTLWVALECEGNRDNTTLYRLMLSINPDALLPGDVTTRIGARIFLLPPNTFGDNVIESASAAWQGNILAESPVIVPVIVDQSSSRTGSVNLLVAWRFRGRDFAKIIFLPTQKQAFSARNTFGFSIGDSGFSQAGTGLYPTLETVAQDYGVAVVANAYLPGNPSVLGLGEGDLDQALRKVLKPIGLDWLYADGAVYVDREYKVVTSN